MPKIKKIRKKKGKKLSNVVPLRKDLKLVEKDEPILSVEEQERDKTNAFARKIPLSDNKSSAKSPVFGTPGSTAPVVVFGGPKIRKKHRSNRLRERSRLQVFLLFCKEKGFSAHPLGPSAWIILA